MESTATKADQILDAAERLARDRGYNGFSFREIAAAVGIKSASVHYHFPTKADLGAAVTRRYTDRFLAALGDPADPATSPKSLLERFVAAYRHAVVDDKQMCLCGMFGAEVAALPAMVGAEVKTFFERNVDWLAVVLSRLAAGGAGDQAAPRRQALTILAALEGALIVARTFERSDVFDRIAEEATRVHLPPA